MNRMPYSQSDQEYRKYYTCNQSGFIDASPFGIINIGHWKICCYCDALRAPIAKWLKKTPIAESFSIPLGLMAENQIEKMSTMKKRNQLTEPTCMAYHRFAFFVWLTVSFGD
jgi:hypothetical protein